MNKSGRKAALGNKMKKEYVVVFSHMGDKLYKVGDKRIFEKESDANRLLAKGLVTEVIEVKDEPKPRPKQKAKGKQEK